MRRDRKLIAPAIVLTSRQTAGRGRGKNAWSAPPGTLTATFCVPADDALPPQLVPLLAGLATLRCVHGFGAIEAQLKWPNDLVVSEQKLAGLLCERIDRVDCIGIGMNVLTDLAELPRDLRARTTALHEHASSAVSMQDVLLKLARELERMFLISRDASIATLLAEFERHHVLHDRDIEVADGDVVHRGRCVGLDRSGRLLLEQESAVSRLMNGTVTRWRGSPRE